MNNQRSNRVISQATVFNTLNAAKAASIKRNQEAAKTKNPAITPEQLNRVPASFGWWHPYLRFGMTGVRPSGQSTWGNTEWKNPGEQSGAPLYMKVGGKHVGIIAPTTLPVCKKLMDMFKIPAEKGLPMNDGLEKKKPTFTMTEYANDDIKDLLQEDGITFKTDPATGQRVAPPASKRNVAYAATELVSEAFSAEVALRLSRGNSILAKIDEDSKRIAADPSEMRSAPSAILAAAMGNTPREKNDIFYSTDSAAIIRGAYPDLPDQAVLFENALVVPTTKIATPIQKNISGKAKKNAGMPMPSGMVRFGMSFGKSQDNKNTKFYDGRTRVDVNGKTQHELATIDNNLINPDNVQLFVLPRSEINGVIDLSSFCFSNLAISLLANALITIVTPSESGAGGAEFGLDDLLGEGGAAPSPAPTAASPAPTAASPAPGEGPAIDMESLMASMSVYEP